MAKKTCGGRGHGSRRQNCPVPPRRQPLRECGVCKPGFTCFPVIPQTLPAAEDVRARPGPVSSASPGDSMHVHVLGPTGTQPERLRSVASETTGQAGGGGGKRAVRMSGCFPLPYPLAALDERLGVSERHRPILPGAWIRFTQTGAGVGGSAPRLWRPWVGGGDPLVEPRIEIHKPHSKIADRAPVECLGSIHFWGPGKLR